MASEVCFESPAAGFESEFNIDGLLRASAYSHVVSAPVLRDTHVSWVILTGPFAYKLEKRVTLDFLDASTLAMRKVLCEEEVRLNRRLAPDLYLDVVAVTRDASGIHIGGAGSILDYAVKM